MIVTSRRDVSGMMVRLWESSPNGRMVTAIFSLVNQYDSARQINGLVWVKSRGNWRKPWNFC